MANGSIFIQPSERLDLWCKFKTRV